MTITYNDLYGHLKGFIPFQLNKSAHGEIFPDGETFTVFSYNTEMCVVKTKTKEVIYFDEKRYSSTTSRLQNFLRKLIRNGEWIDGRS